MEEKLERIIINLQLFADDGDKTEDATPRRKEDARKKGQVCKSADLAQVSTLLFGMLTLNLLFKFYYSFLFVRLEKYFIEMDVKEFSIEKVRVLIVDFASVFFAITGPILLVVLLIGLFANYLQVGFLFTLEPLKPSFEKINILKGLKNLFSLKKIVELLKTIIKLIIIAFYAYFMIKKNLIHILQIPEMDILQGFILIFGITYGIIIRIVMALFFVAVADYFYQRWEFNKSLKMSKQEVKEEFKQTEGDPLIKSRMRQMQREILKKKMIQDVPNATVVITNPTHISIAVQYEDDMSAPKVLAKGVDNMAFRIREIAKENEVPLYENKPLARTLYKNVEVGEEIPEEYYQAVAEVLSYIFNFKK